MAPLRKAWRVAAWPRRLAVLLVLASPVVAQEERPATGPVLAPVLTLDQERLFVESAFGRASLERERQALRALEEENKRIEAELIAEEQALTELRQTLAPEEFTARADAFDQKVEQIRDAQDAKSEALTSARDADRQAFLQAAIPVLGELLGDRKAVAILDKSMIILSLSAIDVTDEAIARVDAVLATEAPAP